MKKALLFFGGLVTGVVLTILVAFAINAANQPNDGFPGLTVFPEKGECITTSGELEVMQVLAPDAALAYTGDFMYDDRMLVLLINNDGGSYYDEQKIKIPSGKCARQIGTYQYTARNEMVKTVPAVVIE
ncbi:MAG: hypothetical protein LBV38_04370 [Alistipes sp.]|jgi:hypothetical protein|nr:hypothetical protein [Alistipes sp.]